MQNKKRCLTKQRLFEPQKIMQERLTGDRREFLVKWVGFTNKETTWDYSSISHCTWILEEWLENKAKQEQNKLSTIKEIIGMKGTKYKYYQVVYADGTSEWITRNELCKKNLDLKIQYHKQLKEQQEGHEIEHKISNKPGRNTKQSNSNNPFSQVEETLKNGQALANNIQQNTEAQPAFHELTNEEYIELDSLPNTGVVDVDQPHSIRSLVIDKKIGDADDKYFACEIVWKIRRNNQQPLDSRVSRLHMKKFYPQLLIKFYEQNMVYHGEQTDEQKEDSSDEENNYVKKDCQSEGSSKTKSTNDESSDSQDPFRSDIHSVDGRI